MLLLYQISPISLSVLSMFYCLLLAYLSLSMNFNTWSFSHLLCKGLK
uniref:ATP synthase F0 subunit 8 n=1 Tax=Trichuris muris TaxID=70415 RepID=A0A0S3M490_TRIMR|nr:ATP synthase F0 subunit 8 [Trichuris muris]BAT21248.1 ATP synthase F0 subunit 8 [Trichuris muris]